MKNQLDDKQLQKLVQEMVGTYKDDIGINFIDMSNLPEREKIVELLSMIMEVLFPGYTGKRPVSRANISFVIGDLISEINTKLSEQIERAYKHRCRREDCDGLDCKEAAAEVTMKLLHRLPEIKELLKADIQAAYDGDPAAESLEEIVISYPGIIATTSHRIAHELYLAQVPLIPRIMSEWAHTETGIDIHPGATIGKSFFIDHGTGVVIGETTVIGNNVKIYQGTTLGALSFPKDERGNIIKGGKRHPTIEDNVTIYAEATILGDIVIGSNCVVGGNAWIKDSVPPNMLITTKSGELVLKERKKKA